MTDGLAVDNCDLGMTKSNLLGEGEGEGGAENLNPNNGEVGFPTITITKSANTASIVAKFGSNAAAILTTGGDQHLAWERDAEGTWICSTDVEAKYRPAGCSKDYTAPAAG